MTANIDTATAVQEAQDVLQQVLSRSATDPDYRQKLLDAPGAAMAEYADVNDDFRIVFVENHADATFVLPDPIDPTVDLSDAELEAVAGGGTPFGVAVVMTIIAAGTQIKKLGNDCAWLS